MEMPLVPFSVASASPRGRVSFGRTILQNKANWQWARSMLSDAWKKGYDGRRLGMALRKQSQFPSRVCNCGHAEAVLAMFSKGSDAGKMPAGRKGGTPSPRKAWRRHYGRGGIVQNKANLREERMRSSDVAERGYGEKCVRDAGAKQSQIKRISGGPVAWLKGASCWKRGTEDDIMNCVGLPEGRGDRRFRAVRGQAGVGLS